jgi:hypothetical protein
LERESSGCLLHSFAHSRYDVLGVRPGSAQELGEQSTLSGNDWPAVDDNVELPPPTLFELDGSPQSITDEGCETRCLCGGCTSGLAVDDSDVHSEEYSSSSSLQSATDRLWFISLLSNVVDTLRANLARVVREHGP